MLRKAESNSTVFWQETVFRTNAVWPTVPKKSTRSITSKPNVLLIVNNDSSQLLQVPVNFTDSLCKAELVINNHADYASFRIGTERDYSKILQGQLLYTAMKAMNQTSMSPEAIVKKILVDGIFKAPQFILADRLIDNPDLRGRIKGLEVPFEGSMSPSPLLLGWMLEKRELSLAQNVTKLQALSEQLIAQIGEFISGVDSLSPYDRERRWNKLTETGPTVASSEEIINPIYFQKRTMRSDLSFCPTG